MHVDNELISQFLTGAMAVFAMVAIGGALANIFRAVSKRFAFTRIALVLALPPFCIAPCLDRSSLDTLYLFAFVIVVLGFLIDGSKHLFFPANPENPGPTAQAAQSAEPDPDERRMVWEKTE